MASVDEQSRTGAEALLCALRSSGVQYLFATAGTDFTPLIEGLAHLPAASVPVAVTIPHETAAIGMAHGYWLVTGQPQALMVHVNVGLANTVMGVINAMSDNVPALVLSGRTPLTEIGHKGGRVTPVQHGQEMFDQSSLMRDSVKYDYEIRYPEQCDSVVKRAASVATADPAGPVYLSLPREPLSEPLPQGFTPAKPPAPTAPPAPDSDAIATLADWLRSASAPVILCQRGDPQGQLSGVLSRLANEHGIAVCEPFTVRNVLPSDDPALIGYDPKAALNGADLVIVVDCGVPWIEIAARPATDARVVHIGPDPLFARRPVRGFRSDLSITADPTRALAALHTACPNAAQSKVRKDHVASKRSAWQTATNAALKAPDSGSPMSPAWFSRCVSDVMDKDAIAFNELGLVPNFMTLKGPNRLFTVPHSGGLGWGLPAALGAQLADRSRLIISAMGDGSYMFANPVACHQIAEALELPILILIKNNGIWNAVRRAVVKSSPDGAAARRNEIPLTSLAPQPDFCAIARASRAHAEQVTQARDLPAALERAIDIIRTERRHVLLDVTVAATDDF